MRVRAMQDIRPINLGIGDQIRLQYQENHQFGGITIKSTTQTLMSETFDEARTVDRIAVVELEGGELSALGMEQGIAGVFGRRS